MPLTLVEKSGNPSPLSGVKLRLAEWALQYRAGKVKRNRRLLPFDEVNKIGLLFDINDEERFRMVQDLVHYLSSKGKQIVTAGYFPGKILPDFCVADYTGYCFNHREIGFWGRPRTDFLKQYMQIPFDLLINLSQEDYFILRYIVTLSRASIKVGISRGEATGLYDISINTETKLPLDTSIEQIFHYLMILNRKSNQNASL